jgi:hypothetical protein
MNRALVTVATVVVVVAGNGCYTMRAELPGTYRRALPDEEITVVDRIDFRTTHYYFLALAPQPPADVLSAPMLEAVRQAGGDGVANVIVDSEFTASDFFVRAITLGIIAPRSYRLRADVVRLGSPPPPGKPLLRPAPRGSEPPPTFEPPPAPVGDVL